MDRSYKVYMHTNLINWKRYIGLTRQEPKKRWSTYELSTPIGKAFRKYGRENFVSEVLIDGLTKEEAERIEIYLIALFRSLTTQWGYNIEKGGSARGKVSDETKEKIRISQHRRWVEDYEHMHMLSHSDEVEKRRAEFTKLTFKDPEVKARFSAMLVKRWSDPKFKRMMFLIKKNNGWNMKSVICDDIEYVSIANFAESNNLDKFVVASWLNGERSMPDEWYDKGLMYKNGDNPRVKRSESGDFDFTVDGIHFTKQSDLSRYLGIGDSTLGRYINGKRKCPQSLLDRGLVPINS